MALLRLLFLLLVLLLLVLVLALLLPPEYTKYRKSCRYIDHANCSLLFRV
jgi:hypothetical protein